MYEPGFMRSWYFGGTPFCLNDSIIRHVPRLVYLSRASVRRAKGRSVKTVSEISIESSTKIQVSEANV